MENLLNKVLVHEGSITLPTYDIKGENRNPVFRSQYGVAHIYPYTLLDDISATAVEKTYHTLVLENQYLKVTVLTELGGRVYSVYDKISDREVFYKNSVIRFAPLAIRGAFFSGGVEFSFPVAHAPTTCDKVNWDTRENEDGSASVYLGGQEHINGLRWTIVLSLYPDLCALSQDVHLHNPGVLPGRYHYWTNASLDANDGTEFVYPLQRARSYEYAGTSSWPFSRLDLIVDEPGLPGMEGVPIWPAKQLLEPMNMRWQKNMLAQVSIFGRNVEWDYFGAWQHKVNHGYAHVANSKDVSGMKLWSWGNAPVGVVNQTALTDDGSVYAETQCGAMETQLDFAFLDPGTTRYWREWWLPLRGMGGLTCASTKAGARIQLTPPDSDHRVKVLISICAALELKDALVLLSIPGHEIMRRNVSLSPRDPWFGEAFIEGKVLADLPITLQVFEQDGIAVLNETIKRDVVEVEPGEDNEEPDPESAEAWYRQGLKHENFDNRENAKIAYREAVSSSTVHADAHLRYGLMLLRSAQWQEAESHLLTAGKNGKPEGYFYAGVVDLLQGKPENAKALFTRVIDEKQLRTAALIGLGKTAMQQGQLLTVHNCFTTAHEQTDEPLTSTLLLAISCFANEEKDKARQLIDVVLKIDPLNLPALYLLSRLENPVSGEWLPKLDRLLKDDHSYYSDLACFFIEVGLPKVALEILIKAWHHSQKPLTAYLAGYTCSMLHQDVESKDWFKKAQVCSPEFAFPGRLYEVLALEHALKQDGNDHLAMYCLGNFYYAHERFEEGITYWENAKNGLSQFDVIYRNLGLAYWERQQYGEKAITNFETALSLRPDNYDLFILLDDLYKVMGKDHKRAQLLEMIDQRTDIREDVHKRAITMRVELGRHEEALKALEEEWFIPLEMDQSFHGVYVQALMQRAKEKIRNGEVESAITDYQKMLEYPSNLGVGAPTKKSQAGILYQLGLAHEKIGEFDLAIKSWQEASREFHEKGSDLFPYVQKSLDKLSRYSELGFEI